MPTNKRKISETKVETKVKVIKNGQFLELYNKDKHGDEVVPTEVPHTQYKRAKATEVVYNPNQPKIFLKYSGRLHDDKIQKSELKKDTIKWGKYKDNKGVQAVTFKVEDNHEVYFKYDPNWHKGIEPTLVSKNVLHHGNARAIYKDSDGKPQQIKIDKKEFDFKENQLPTLKADSKFRDKNLKIVRKSTLAYAKKKFAIMQKKQKVNPINEEMSTHPIASEILVDSNKTSDQQAQQNSLPVIETQQSGNNPFEYARSLAVSSLNLFQPPNNTQEDKKNESKHNISFLLN